MGGIGGFEEISSSRGYDSNIPIQSVLEHFNIECAGVGYGDNTATFHDIRATQENIRKANEYLKDFHSKYLAFKGSGGLLSVKTSTQEEIDKSRLETLKAHKTELLGKIELIDKEISVMQDKKNTSDIYL